MPASGASLNGATLRRALTGTKCVTVFIGSSSCSNTKSVAVPELADSGISCPAIVDASNAAPGVGYFPDKFSVSQRAASVEVRRVDHAQAQGTFCTARTFGVHSVTATGSLLRLLPLQTARSKPPSHKEFVHCAAC